MNRMLALVLLVGLGGCYSAPVEFQEHACQRNTDCADSYTCQVGFCRHSTAATASGSATGTLATGTSGTGTHSASTGVTASSASGTTGPHSTATSSAGTTGTHGTGTSGTTATFGTGTNGPGTTGTTGGPGAECAVCRQNSECNSNQCFDLGNGGRCLGVCLANGGCADPDSKCYAIAPNGPGYCIPNSFSCEPNTSTTGTFGTVGTTGQTTGTTGLCAPLNTFVGVGNGAVCCSGYADPSGYCSRPSMNTVGTTGTMGTTGTHGTTGTTGTTGGECATCVQNADCASSQCLDVGTGGRCLGVCLANGGCADPASSCIDVFGNGQAYCVPNSFSCTNGGSTTGVSATIGSTGTIGTATTGHSTGTTGVCAPNGTFVGNGNGGVCCSGFADPAGFCGQPGMTTTGTLGSTGTTGSCCAMVRCSSGSACDPFTCQCTLHGSTGSTGTTGGPTATSTSGSTGACTSVEGTTDQDCGATHATCGGGETCQAFSGAGTGVPLYHVCACHYVNDASGASTDSCASNGTGETVCDVETVSCRAPSDFEPPSSVGNGCAPGYGPRSFPGGTVCVQGCTVSSDCDAPFAACAAGALTVTSNGVTTTYAGYCNYNTCGPDTPGQPGTTYYGVCNAHGVGDGICQPLQNNTQSYVGVCFATGAALVGDTCSGYHSGSQDCAGTALCVPTGQAPDACVATLPTECLPTCNASTPGTCPSINGRQTTCYPFQGAPAGPLQAGLCY
jgi:hypothetical protein